MPMRSDFVSEMTLVLSHAFSNASLHEPPFIGLGANCEWKAVVLDLGFREDLSKHPQIRTQLLGLKNNDITTMRRCVEEMEKDR
jgi:hypothetical protein